ncbi:MAG TPA: L-rhamnose mutarotase [Fodinibius sp.]|nr:L-rhamnose mutarotase [Fodinibius sp.]
MPFKRYCKTMKLEDDAELIEKYKQAHAKKHFWPEITQGMEEVGILDMEIYISGNRLFMIMDTVAGFDHEKAMKELGRKPRQAEWEAHVSSFQQTNEKASADEKWQLMERMYELDQTEDYRAAEGQLKNFKKK